MTNCKNEIVSKTTGQTSGVVYTTHGCWLFLWKKEAQRGSGKDLTCITYNKSDDYYVPWL